MQKKVLQLNNLHPDASHLSSKFSNAIFLSDLSYPVSFFLFLIDFFSFYIFLDFRHVKILGMPQSTFGLFLFFSNNSSSYVIFGHDKDQFFCFDYPFSPHTSRGDSKKRNKKQSKLRGPNLYYLFSDQFRKSENV